MIIFLPNCSASINFTRFIFKSFKRHVCSAHFSKAGMRLGPAGAVARQLFLQIVFWGCCFEDPPGEAKGRET